MARALELRDELAGDSDPIRASVTDFVLLACARALRTVPQVNASWSEAGIVSHGAVAVGFAVALADDGLVVPVLRDVDRLSLAELVEARVAAVSRARAGSLGPDELEGATFTVSNLGMLGVTEFHAIVNPPESGILAIGAIEDRVIPVDGSPAIRPMTTISLSADHRVYSGATAAKFISAVKRGIESPVRILAASCSRKHGRG
jgi:pyruvate dehydrogenase E2 component (dihydrolipoamide acetyltransferase)